MARVSQGFLRNNYECVEEFVNYDDIYKLAHRLGFESAEEAWDFNPFIQWSVEPRDFKRADLKAYYAKRMRRWTAEKLERERCFASTGPDSGEHAEAWQGAIADETLRRVIRENRLHAIADSV